ncbi:uncharacterized protein LY89DRAFT_347582 [Mollisia scopiformis]|uniref:Uncharacterized protein n=1 Tax=Mollisia scopiformis TaxID=149040 RepID=A0A132B6I4_MOLSC|nr:uncharacterized protein LY89DRAFT_347582 [Mollisia scopiformis]KUJ08010.1 hypothetical protein LY89DRAFT_347582 [Mollisia scopiformis]
MGSFLDKSQEALLAQPSHSPSLQVTSTQRFSSLATNRPQKAFHIYTKTTARYRSSSPLYANMTTGLEGPAISLATGTGLIIWNKKKQYLGDVQTSEHVLKKHLDRNQEMQKHIDQFPSEYSSSSKVAIEAFLEEQRQIQETGKTDLAKVKKRKSWRYALVSGTREARARSIAELRNGIEGMDRKDADHKKRSDSRESRERRRERKAPSQSNDDASRKTVGGSNNSMTQNPFGPRSTTENVDPPARTKEQHITSKSHLTTKNVHPSEDRTVKQDTKRSRSIKKNRSIKRRKSIDSADHDRVPLHQSPLVTSETSTASVPAPVLPPASPQLAAAALPQPVPIPVAAIQAQVLQLAPQHVPNKRRNWDPVYRRVPRAGR